MQQCESWQVSSELFVNFGVRERASAIKLDFPAIHSITKLNPITFSLICCYLGLWRSSRFLVKIPSNGL